MMISLDYSKMSYQEQVKHKEQNVLDTYKQAKINIDIQPMIINDEPRHYRHKVTASATTVFERKRPVLKLGMFIEKTHDIDPGFSHFIHDEDINHVLEKIEYVLNQYKITAYDIRKKQGILKHVLIRKSYLSHEMLIVFVTNGKLFPNHKNMINDIRKDFEQIKSVSQMIQNKQTPIVLYGEEKVLFGKGFIEDGFGDLKFRLSAKSFYQVNPKQMIRLYEEALHMANINKDQKVMDCYSGIGTISLMAAKLAKEVVAIEVNQSAVNDAIHNAKNNQINNVKFYCSDVELFMDKFNEKIDVLIMDPTRIGATLKFMNAVKKLKPQKIVYISCFPETQARDVSQLLNQYRLIKIQPVDMFSYTEHVESIALLTLK